jgi:hypothetical protein
MGDFDQQKYQVDPIRTSAPGPKPRIPRSELPYFKMPNIWWDCLGKAGASGSTYRVAGLLIKVAWRQLHYLKRKHDPVVKLTNEALAAIGVSRKGKAFALRVMRTAGLIAVEERFKKSPLVTVRFVR